MAFIETLVYFGIFSGLYFAVFVLTTFFENKRFVCLPTNCDNLPGVSIIVPCYNEENNIEKTLNSLINLDYPKEKLEVIVVDDGSEDKTFQKAKEFEKKDERVKVFRKKNGGKYTALNFGLKRAKFSFVGSVDADSFLEKSALKKIMSHFQNKEVMAVISTVKIANPKNIIEGIQYVEYLLAAFLRKVFSLVDSVNVTPGPLSIFKKEVFDFLGPYKKAHQTEDLEFAFRLQRANLKIAHAIDAIVYTTPCPNLKSLFRQRLRWRRGFLLNLKDYPDLLNFKKHGNLAFLLYYNLIGSFISLVLAGYTLWKLGNFVFQKINQLSLLQGDFSKLFSFSFSDWRFFNTTPLLFLGIISVFIILVYLFFGKKLTFDKKPIKKDAVLYLIIYNFLNAAWWLFAISFVLFKKEVSWKK